MIKGKPLILSIETATNICSVALSYGENIVSYYESREKNSHSKMLSLLIDKLFRYTYYSLQDIDCVAVSQGPGSYTGLRIGVSTAKGFAYGLDKPLIAVDTLQILAMRSSEKHPNCLYLPMIDARRMEVYTCLYNENLEPIKDISADIIDHDLYIQYQGDKPIVISGDGAEKCMDILSKPCYIFDLDSTLSAKYMTKIATQKFEKQDFVDTAYFEPYYLKEFIAQPSKVKGLYQN